MQLYKFLSCCARLVTAATNWPKDPSRDAGNWACLKLHLRVEAKYWRVAIGLGHENPYHRNIRLLISITTAKHGKWRRPFFDPYMYPSQGLHDFHFTTPSFTFLTTATVPFKFQTIMLNLKTKFPLFKRYYLLCWLLPEMLVYLTTSLVASQPTFQLV
ncbi:hypothetical protein MtrunA17_Chr4g0061821 [Medicago truncatula]|uniref:Transmembrane protein n=1 Tax=Medicago truncatula TaxID=3880 RepID=A0A072URS7_MEDTR|nr:hypothetical protein MTR_4g110110 [Medicago truncatula]RHN63761.1 hypothetical protein MtrunA17_Chr4g0061821 [Medicago truncatula]